MRSPPIHFIAGVASGDVFGGRTLASPIALRSADSAACSASSGADLGGWVAGFWCRVSGLGRVSGARCRCVCRVPGSGPKPSFFAQSLFASRRSTAFHLVLTWPHFESPPALNPTPGPDTRPRPPHPHPIQSTIVPRGLILFRRLIPTQDVSVSVRAL